MGGQGHFSTTPMMSSLTPSSPATSAALPTPRVTRWERRHACWLSWLAAPILNCSPVLIVTPKQQQDSHTA